MERRTIERELHIEASPEVVFDVVSRPEHVRRWWSEEAEYAVETGGVGRIGFRGADGVGWAEYSVVDVVRPSLFSFRWTHPEGAVAERGNSFLVVFSLEPSGSGTLLRLTETGFGERGWEDEKVAAEHADHVTGWDFFLPRLVPYAEQVGAAV